MKWNEKTENQIEMRFSFVDSFFSSSVRFKTNEENEIEFKLHIHIHVAFNGNENSQ